MTRFVTFLRAINVGGHSKIPMLAIRSAYERLGCLNVKTILQSGNVIFDAVRVPDLATELKRIFSYESPVIIRKISDIDRIKTNSPFAKHQHIPTNLQMVMFLEKKPNLKSLKQLPCVGGEEIWAIGKELYITYPHGSARSKLTIKKIEKAIEVTGTMRNWNTVEKLI